ncbi:HEPN domain-containing protein [Metallosphaera hakonensis]|uniref:HEPN domain-containing protein n=1 Tax=Metallosphaera hakonensis TaxID=79601 RepID=UPI000AF21B1A|nr:HEPN domain-containing protein [Metallosphaera hakonensis]
MNSKDLAEGYLKEASIRMKYAELSLTEDKDFAFCVRASQETVELSIKLMLRLVGVEYPKTHDPGKILDKNKDKLPDWLKMEIDNIVYISRWLRAEREPSMYGDEIEGLSPTQLYTESYCKKSVGRC